MTVLGLAGSGFGLSVALCGLMRRLAPRWGLVDRPGGHKGHRQPTPLGGGVAIWLTTILILVLGTAVVVLAGDYLPEPLFRHVSGARKQLGELAEIIGLATIIMIMGLVDDIKNLDWRPRLGIQLGCATILAVVGIRITLFGPFAHPIVGGTLTVFWIVGMTNAFNMLDNMDGLAASVGLIAALLFCAAQVAVGDLFVPAILLILAGALAGFLIHNRAPARLFMGDAGSNFLGFLLGTLTVVGTFTRPEYSPYSVLAPLLVMAVPLYDMSSVILIRLREGRSPFKGDRRHFSHRLVARGLTPPQAVWTIDLVTLAGGLGALLLPWLDWPGAVVVLAQTVCLLGVVAILEFSASRSEQDHAQTRGEIPGPTESTPSAATERQA
jgi:UDP-GlcNAc:undecaprenyl-phosphate/decaprenyl-phosphate GlcNAc-1-phosphate transferase